MIKKMLNNGIEIPALGLGVFQTKEGKETIDAVRWAIEAGYRLIDTAKAYGNEKDVGVGIKQSEIKRVDLFITTKLWNEDIRQGVTRDAFFTSMKKMGLEYLDMYLIHWPAEGYLTAWKEMEKLYKEGYVKAIGVCNFQEHHLDNLLHNSDIIPVVNQIECHPLLSQVPLRQYCNLKHIICQAWSPLGGTGGNLLQNAELLDIAKNHGKSIAQIIIRWDIQNEMITIPKSIHQERIVSNMDVFDFSLSADDMSRIDNLNINQRVGPSPDNFNF